ncbi:MAG: hypothetical protein HFH28_09740, partial [Clostridiaceae bacterium]|nr:hypothetical protein [Clostridiaceae bacterium]
RPARRRDKVFTRFFYKKIAGAGQSPAAARAGPELRGVAISDRFSENSLLLAQLPDFVIILQLRAFCSLKKHQFSPFFLQDFHAL